MADPIIPAGAFAAMKAGQPQPSPVAKSAPPPAAAAKPEPAKPETKLRKSEPAKVEAPEPPKDLTPAEKKIWKLKADGEEFEFDASDEEAVKREIMKARGADKKFRESAGMRKQAEQFFEMIKNPATLKDVLTDPRIGVDLKKFAEDYVWEQIQESKLTPEEKSQRERDKKLAEYEAQAAKAAEEGKTKAQQLEQQRYEAHYEQTITQALEMGGIPKTAAAVSRMAEYQMRAVEQGMDLSPAELVEIVRQDYLADFNAMFGASDGDQLFSLFGEQAAEKIRKADLKRLKSAQGTPFPQRSPQKKAAAGGDVKPKKVAGSVWKEDLIKDFLNRK